MDVSGLDVVVLPEFEEREAWWRQSVQVGSADAASATMLPNRSVEGAPSRILPAA